MPVTWEYALIEDVVGDIKAHEIKASDWNACTPSMCTQLGDNAPKVLSVSGAVCGQIVSSCYKFVLDSCDDGVQRYSHVNHKRHFLDFYVRRVAEGTLLMNFAIVNRSSDDWTGTCTRALTGTVIFEITFNPDINVNQLEILCKKKLSTMGVCTMQCQTAILHLHNMPRNCKINKLFARWDSAEDAVAWFDDTKANKRTKLQHSK